MSYCSVQTKVWDIPVSSGASPYTIVPFEVNEELISSVGGDNLTAFIQGIAFFIWEDYSLEDFKDFIKNSKEYRSVSKDLKELYLTQRLTKIRGKADLLDWQNNQMNLALGIAINELRSTNVAFKKVEDVVAFSQVIKVDKAILSDVILCS
ncbi:hypothetical protein [Algoriphagus sp. Y33]|uniref:hypothetical protein n=1 Tax=Algoriphagus sp. Y33 TaxID=2772483 RepID=UPI00177C1782|nr:hypothetical protein [Algoriphagus sp. Y33]